MKAWAKAMKFDTPVIILHSGHHELVCSSHRKWQTLYVPRRRVTPDGGSQNFGSDKGEGGGHDMRDSK